MHRLSTCRFSRFTSVSLSGSTRHALFAQGFEDVAAGPFEHERDRVDRKLVEERQHPVGDEIDRLDQEMPAAHGRVERAEVE